MRDFIKCPLCSEYHFSDKECDPAFTVFHEEYLGENGKVIRAFNEEEAAEKYARYYNENSAEYPLMNGDEIEIFVEGKDGERTRFKVGAEPEIHYTVTQL